MIVPATIEVACQTFSPRTNSGARCTPVPSEFVADCPIESARFSCRVEPTVFEQCHVTRALRQRALQAENFREFLREPRKRATIKRPGDERRAPRSLVFQIVRI